MLDPVIPAKAGTSGREVSAGLPEIPAFAGTTKFEKSVEKSFRQREVIEFTRFRENGLWHGGDTLRTLLPP
ncbi:MAG TPA: hypothetical protein VF782_12790 [Allosphingosinicella sp.]|jgi:hypothetical protein